MRTITPEVTMDARVILALALGTLLAGAGCRSEQVAERWQQIERERDAGEQVVSSPGDAGPGLNEASLLLGNMERQIARTASLDRSVRTRRAAEVELMEIRPVVAAQQAEQTAEQPAVTEDEVDVSRALAAIDARRMEIRHELERSPFVLDDDWPAFVSRLHSMTEGLKGDVQALKRHSTPRAAVSLLEQVGLERAI
jgi:hypothetical protein